MFDPNESISEILEEVVVDESGYYNKDSVRDALSNYFDPEVVEELTQDLTENLEL